MSAKRSWGRLPGEATGSNCTVMVHPHSGLPVLVTCKSKTLLPFPSVDGTDPVHTHGWHQGQSRVQMRAHIRHDAPRTQYTHTHTHTSTVLTPPPPNPRFWPHVKNLSSPTQGNTKTDHTQAHQAGGPTQACQPTQLGPHVQTLVSLKVQLHRLTIVTQGDLRECVRVRVCVCVCVHARKYMEVGECGLCMRSVATRRGQPVECKCNISDQIRSGQGGARSLVGGGGMPAHLTSRKYPHLDPSSSIQVNGEVEAVEWES